jgi:hypothetical protein
MNSQSVEKRAAESRAAVRGEMETALRRAKSPPTCAACGRKPASVVVEVEARLVAFCASCGGNG